MARPKGDCGVCEALARKKGTYRADRRYPPHPDGVRHLASGRYQARYLGPDKRSYSKTFQTTKDARAWLAGEQAAISAGRWHLDQIEKAGEVAFREYAETWLLSRRVKGEPLADRTIEGYRDLLDRFILDSFGDKALNEITRAQVKRWYDETAVSTPTYRARAYSLLRAVLATAVDDELIVANPARIRSAGQVDRQHKVEPATLDELSTLTEAMPPRYRLLVQLAAFCALRFGELTELRRHDVDTSRGILRVRRAVVLVDGEFVVKKPKSRAGVRDVTIPSALMPMVREHLLQHTAPGPDGLLFPAKDDPDRHLRQSSLTRVFYPARAAAGRPDLRFHDLRHTGAVLAAQTGATLAELMGRLGHSTSQAALRYQHAAADRDAVIASKLSAMIEAAAAT